MADLFARKIETRETAIMRMTPSEAAGFIDATRKRLPRTSANRWSHNFLDDIYGQMDGGYRQTLTPAQVGHLLRAADHADIEINNGD